MHKTIIVTLLVQAVLILVGGIMAPAMAATNKVVLSADQVVKAKVEKIGSKFSAAIVLVRGTSLYDFQDGSKKDSMDYLFIPSYKTALGSVTAKIIYSQDLKDNSPGASDFADSTITFAKSAIKWEWSSPYILTLTPTLTAVVPLSKNSIKRDQLQTSIIAGVSFGIIPDGLAKESGWSLAIGLTAGRNFHQYQESIDGSIVLNRYSSNQTLNLGYAYEDFSVGLEYVHKSRFTYQNNTKDSFEFSQEIGYSINNNFSVALGHSNIGSGLKANGSEANFSIISEKDSTVYAQLGITF